MTKKVLSMSSTFCQFGISFFFIDIIIHVAVIHNNN